MKQVIAIKKNHEFRRIYAKGTSAATACLVLYHRKNRFGKNRLGLTVSTKVGCAVVRNRTRRRLREIYRLHKAELAPGEDLILVARVKSAHVPYAQLEKEYLRLLGKLGILRKEGGKA